MPIYEYSCEKCQNEFELLIRSDETPICPTCGGEKVHRELSVPAAHSTSDGLAVHQPNPGTCGRPQCGTGGCQMM